MTEIQVQLSVVSIRTLSDAVPERDGALPDTYSVALGLSRRITAAEYAEVASSVPGLEGVEWGFGGRDDAMWLTLRGTTIDFVHQNLPRWLELFPVAALRAAPVQEAVDSLRDFQRAEFHRRHEKLKEVNRWLLSLRHEPPPGTD